MEHDETTDGLPGQDSFLDIIANTVGILVILVMVVGVRAAHNPPASSTSAASTSQPAPASSNLQTPAEAEKSAHRAAGSILVAETARMAAELEQVVGELRDAERRIDATTRQAINLRHESELVDARRLELNMLRGAVESDLAERRGKLDAESQVAYDVQNQIDQLQMRLEELTKEQLGLLDQPADVEELESVPTPLARTVTGDEIHVRLRGRRLAVVPVDALLDEVRDGGGVDYLRSQLASGGAGVDVFGPIDGFRMRLSLRVQVHDLPGTSRIASPVRQSLAQMAEFLPTRGDVGESIEQALMPNAPLMQALRAQRSQRPAVVLWVYPDSYGDIRTLKRVLWEASIPLALRPLDNDDEITFSTHGTKSQAQ